jgi:hypothetical protein
MKKYHLSNIVSITTGRLVSTCGKEAQMQNRKIAVFIQTLDDRHCSKKCHFYKEGFVSSYCDAKMLKYEDGIGYLRTAKCIKSEIKKDAENI